MSMVLGVGAAAGAALAAAVVAAIAEGISPAGLDNLTVPLSAALILYLLVQVV
jgi:dolichol kinase